ncbi:MAG: hypothetical protein MI802_11175, partial [Desulfobacterales bacterium]|nr:hypothetical protein [Desulfobacterales bacterium]
TRTTDAMSEKLPDDISADLAEACRLHERATADYTRCEAFSRLMSDILTRLEDGGYDDTADKVMGVLLDCSPKTGAHCDKATIVAQAVKKLKKPC